MKMLTAVLACLLIAVAYTPYIRHIRKHQTRPHVYTWFITGFATLLVFGVQVSNGGGWGSLPMLVAGLTCLLILVLSLKYKRAHITKIDTVCLVLAILAFCLWLIADKPVLSIAALVATDVLAFIPTIRKSWRKPNQETAFTYAVSTVRFGLSAIAVQNYTLVTLLFPISALILDGFIFTYLLVRRYQLGK